MSPSRSKSDIDSFIRPTLTRLKPYSASRSSEMLAKELGLPVESIVKLDGNENLYGCSPRVQKALADYRLYNIYPDAGQVELHRQLQEYTGIDAECIVADDGSNTLINNIFRLFLEPGDKVINFVPTFDLFRICTVICGAEPIDVPRNNDRYDVDVKAAKAAIDARTKLIVLNNPNNPTGTLTPREDILELADTGRPLLVDEAYYEFCGETVASLTRDYPNLMVTRTFSKWAGIAGLRVGYGLFSPKIAEHLLKIKMPFSVATTARIAVRESLADTDYLMRTVRAIVKEKERLFSELSKLPFLRPFSSKANFILCLILKGKAGEIQKKLERKGILVRYFNLPYLENSIRISVGKPEHTDALIKELREIGDEING